MRHLSEIARVFGRLGVTGFGGPVAVIALMEEEMSRRLNWLTAAEFGTLYATCKVLPGPVSTQVAIALGRRRGGTIGGIVAGVAFILPAFLLVLGFAALYAKIPNERPTWFQGLFSGLQAGALSVILLSAWALAKPFKRRADAWFIGLVAAALIGWKPTLEPWVIAAFGAAGAWFATKRSRKQSSILRADPLTLLLLTWVCFKAGSLVFGSGLAIVPLLEGEVVQHFHWLTHPEFMDALAIGQITPGPVVITATFIGYQLTGTLGAVLATVAIFLPGFLNMLWIVPKLWKYVDGRPGTQGFSDAALPAVVGGIVATALRLAVTQVHGWQDVAAALVALALLIIAKAPAWAVIPAAGAFASLLSFI